ncbi:hypothetical protein [Spiroplasma taiwanense]|uniref:Lipoprotein n=1 Tax=Spiroplasma taiwanense CT-1 TaxID=1276220 RepID=S5MDB6_9MOLU|nr:hypothetical protein [Spiroplasma taiwanense]AGR41698.1 hypothetical protein STAIW_v1c11150 [Spiroplasma taiwanense CT-1]
MKKLLSLVGAISLGICSSATVVSCGSLNSNSNSDSTEKKPSEMTKEERIEAINKLLEEINEIYKKSEELGKSGNVYEAIKLQFIDLSLKLIAIYELDMGENLVYKPEPGASSNSQGQSRESVIDGIKKAFKTLEKDGFTGLTAEQILQLKKEVYEYWGISE